MNEINRLIRHGVAPLVAWLVAGGYLPEAMQGDLTEALVLLTGIVVPLLWSRAREALR